MTSQPAQPYMAPVVDHPADLRIEDPPKRMPVLPLLRLFWGLILLIPHGIILYVYGILSGIAWVVALIIMIVTGRYPKGLFDFNVGYQRWSWRVISYALLMTDAYPPFSNRPSQ